MESNEKFYEYFEEYGEIKSPTKLDKYPDTDVFNGIFHYHTTQGQAYSER